MGRRAARGVEAASRDRSLEGGGHPGRRPERVASARRAAPGRRDVLARRPRLDERRRGARQAREAAEARGRHALHDRLDRDRLLTGAPIVVVGSAQVETTLLVLKLAFLVLLYLFIWRIVRSAARALPLPRGAVILAPQQAG